jgi:signal transduction histidine kinase
MSDGRSSPGAARHTIVHDDFFAALLGIATHDLRQPLQVIMAEHEILARLIADGTALAHLERGSRAGVQLFEQLNMLADALRLHESSRGLGHGEVLLRPLLEALAEEHTDEAHHRGIDLRIIGARDAVWSDPLLLAAILRNLVRNSLKYTAEGGRVLVGCRHRCGAIRVEVRDTGIGIAPHHLPHIFEPFQRLDAAAAQGLGLGLFVVKCAADWLGHPIEVQSALGWGSCFAISLEPTGRAPSAHPSVLL